MVGMLSGPLTRSAGPTPRTAGTSTLASDAEAEGLCVTHWFESGTDGAPYSAFVRFSGTRVGSGGRPRAGDSFVKEETVNGIVPGSGPVSVTTWVSGITPGEWIVTAELTRTSSGRSRPSDHRVRNGGRTLPRAAWSWRRWSVSEASFNPVKTNWAPVTRFTRIPAVIHGSWISLIAVGVFVGAVVQTAIVAQENVSVDAMLILDALALAAGIVGGKVWYAASQPRPWRQSLIEGMSVDGFLLAAVAAAAITMVALSLPMGVVLDASTPGLFFGVAIGRWGCFLTGCCAGRCTRSRWGVWSSDRRVGARRIPTQLLESATGLAIGLVAIGLLLLSAHRPSGLVFVAAIGAYVLARQFLLRLRAEAHSAARAQVTAAVAALVIVAAAVLWLVGG